MVTEIQFEKALERLEKIVQDLEAGDISLEEALKKYEEGVKLCRSCQEKLATAEKRIEALTRTLNGALKKEPFVFEEEGKITEGASKTRKKNPGASSAPSKEDRKDDSQDEDLLF